MVAFGSVAYGMNAFAACYVSIQFLHGGGPDEISLGGVYGTIIPMALETVMPWMTFSCCAEFEGDVGIGAAQLSN